MDATVIEVTPRGQDEAYHACFSGNTAVWECGNSIEAAILELILTFTEKFKLSVEDVKNARALTANNALSLLMGNQLLDQVEIKFLPHLIR